MDLKKYEENLKKLREYITVIREAWIPFLIILGLCVIGIWKALDWKYSGQIETLEKEIAFKDAVIKDYRERLNIVRPTESSYSIFTNEELRNIRKGDNRESQRFDRMVS